MDHGEQGAEPQQPNTSEPAQTSQPQTWIYEGMDPDLLPRKRGRPKKGSEKSQTSTHNLQFMMDQLKSFKKARTQDVPEPSSGKQFSQSVTLSGVGPQPRLAVRPQELSTSDLGGASLQQVELQPVSHRGPVVDMSDASGLPLPKDPQRLVPQKQTIPTLQQQLYEQEKPLSLSAMEQAPPKVKYAPGSSSYIPTASPRVSSS